MSIQVNLDGSGFRKMLKVTALVAGLSLASIATGEIAAYMTKFKEVLGDKVENIRGSVRKALETHNRGELFVSYETQEVSHPRTIEHDWKWSGVDILISEEAESRQMIQFDVPEKYARQFSQDENAGKLVHKYDLDHLAEAQQVYSHFVDSLLRSSGLNQDGRHQVQRIDIMGGASDDALAQGLGEADEPNFELSHARAETAKPMIVEAFARKGIRVSPDSVGVSGIEYILNDEEVTQLDRLAKDEGYKTADDLIYDYNDGICNNPLLDRLIGSKRNVEIIITLQSGKVEKKTVSVPFAIFLPLLLLGIKRGPRTPRLQSLG